MMAELPSMRLLYLASSQYRNLYPQQRYTLVIILVLIRILHGFLEII